MPSDAEIRQTGAIEAYLARRWSGSPRLQDYVRDVWADYKQLDVADRDHVVHQLVSGDDERFLQRLWELQLGSHLLRLGHRAQSPKIGPDFRFEKDGLTIWVEAISPSSRGIPPEWFASPTIEGTTYDQPNREILLRWTSAFWEKRRKFKRYAANGIILPTEACVIAVNGSQLSGVFSNPHGISTYPWAVEVAFPVGPRQATFYRGSDRVGWGNAERHQIQNLNDQPVELYPFLTPECAGISALITCDDRCPSDRSLHLYIAHNPLATVPLPLGTFGVTAEEWQALPVDRVQGEYSLTMVR